MGEQADVLDRGAAVPDGAGGDVAQSRRGRWVVLAAAVIVGLTALALWARSYDPLTEGSFSGAPGFGASRVDDPLFGSVFVADGAAGSKVAFLYSLRNEGRVAVTVDSGEGPAAPSDNLYTVRWGPALGTERTIGGSRPSDSVTSMRVAPGEEVAMWVTVTKPPCAPGTFSSITNIPVLWSALGVTKRHDVELSPGGAPQIVLCKP